MYIYIYIHINNVVINISINKPVLSGVNHLGEHPCTHLHTNDGLCAIMRQLTNE